MGRSPEDPDNPEWTEADFAEADGPEALSDAERAAFPRTSDVPPGLSAGGEGDEHE